MAEDAIIIVRDIVVTFLDNKSLAHLACTCQGMRDACRGQIRKNKKMFARTRRELRYLADLTRETRENLTADQYNLHWWYHCHIAELHDMYYHLRPRIRYRDIFPVAVQYDLASRDPRLQMIVKNLDASDRAVENHRHAWYSEYVNMLIEQRDAWFNIYETRLQQMHYPMLLDVETGTSGYFLSIGHARLVHYLLEHETEVMKPVTKVLHATIFPGWRKFRKALGKFKAKKALVTKKAMTVLGNRRLQKNLMRLSFRNCA